MTALYRAGDMRPSSLIARRDDGGRRCTERPSCLELPWWGKMKLLALSKVLLREMGRAAAYDALNSLVGHMEQKDRTVRLTPYPRSLCAQNRPTFLLRSTARYPEIRSEPPKVVRGLYAAVTTFVLAGVIPWAQSDTMIVL